jgi:hypothetical protein
MGSAAPAQGAVRTRIEKASNTPPKIRFVFMVILLYS